MPRYDKLVRDHITDRLTERGISHTVRSLDDADYADALRAKLREEVAEYEAASNAEHRLLELADIVEVVRALAQLDDATHEDIEARRAEKEQQAGRFDRRVFLIDTE